MQQEWQARNYPQTHRVNGTITQRMDPGWQCRVLVVDDDDVVREQLVALLKNSGYAVHGASSGADALRALGSGNCQILLTDWQMPDMDGLDLCRHVRLERRNGDVYVMMLTVRDREQDMLIGIGAGADDYLIKGATNEEILARLAVARHHARWE
jgi:DNA-binding response OmpR family regulator